MEDENCSLQHKPRRKRPRPETKNVEMCNNNYASAVNAPQNLAPHLLRLLKLVEEGSVEHAQLAASQLSEITAGSSPVVLWDVLGRLQGFLTSPHWKTRQNASVAMEGVARQLPIPDQRDFLEHTAAFHRDKNAITNNSVANNNDSVHTWLTLLDLNKNLMSVLKKGRILLSSSETKYDQLEEDALEQLDVSSRGDADFVTRRVQLQRQILARRLGLSSFLSQVSGKHVEAVLSEEDLIPFATHRLSNKKMKVGGDAKTETTHGLSSTSIHALLVFEIQQQQQQQQQSKHQHGLSHRAIQHQNAQRLLATELVYRMFDATWYIRHGSLLGILALMRAWKVHETTQFGIWPHDIMSRCLCVLALDRFADYSETATSSGSGGVVAPVREMAGQVFSVLYRTAPESLQKLGFETLLALANQGEDRTDDWEIRYAALLTIKYISALQANLPAGAVPESHIGWTKSCYEMTLEAATAGLSDPSSDDIRGVAAQIVVIVFSNQETAALYKQSPLASKILRHLWDALSPKIFISSSVKDLVGLLSTWVFVDFRLLLENIPLNETKEDPCSLLLSKLQMLLTCPYLSVRTNVVILVGAVAKRLGDRALRGRIKTDKQSPICVATSYCDVVRAVFGLYFECVRDLDMSSQDIGAFLEACEKTWLLLAEASSLVLSGHEEKRFELQKSMILDFFGLVPGHSDANLDCPKLMESSFGRRHRFRLDVADALAILLSCSELKEKDPTLDLLEMCIRLCVNSPFVSQCERACLLFTSICRSRQNFPLSAIVGRCNDTLLKLVLVPPQCLAIDEENLQGSCASLLNVVCASFQYGVEILSKGNGNLDSALKSVSILLKEATSRYLLEHSIIPVTLNSMRLSVATAGSLVAGGMDFLPTKLTPIVRSLMTSIQNEFDEECQGTTCRHMVALLELLSRPSPVQRQEAFQKTQSKVFQNLCRVIVSDEVPSSVVASRVIAQTVSNAALPLQSLPVIWVSISPLVEPNLLSDHDLVESLLLLKAVCGGLGGSPATTSLLIGLFLSPLATLCCTSSNAMLRKRAAECVEMMAGANQTLAMKTVLPTIALLCMEKDDSTRDGACDLLLVVVSGPTMPLCPYVRSLLPVAMQLMTDSSETCAKKGARIFSKLVQLAPLVKASVALRLLPDSWDEHADRVMDHLIQGKPLPPCKISPPVSEALKASGVSLRPYQLEGIAWLRFLQTVKLNGALTDAMGLGKTLQSLVGVALAHGDSENGESLKSIVICPSSVVGHWMKEVTRFFPGTTVFRPFCLLGSNHKKEEPSDYNLVVTSYAVLRTEISYLSATKWRCCVLDEGHLLKNPKTATAKAARKLHARHKLILTGTPVQNKVHEVWATFDFLMPNFLGSSAAFSKDFAKPISKSQSTGASASDIALGVEKLKLLHQQVLPFILRREKEDVLKELPPKIITSIPCDMSPRQQELYQAFCSSSQGKRSIRAFNRALQEPSSETVMPSLGSDILKALLYLRLVCTHPALVDSNGIIGCDVRQVDCSGKLVALKEILRETGMQCQDMSAADNDSSLIYVDAEEGDDSETEDHNNVLDPGSNDGAAAASLSSYPTPSRAKCLIFAQFTHSLDVVEEFLCQHFPGIPFLRLDGKVQTEKRSEIVDSFNGNDSIKILLLTTRIGGLGLNLTGADTVIFLEHDWNPHADLQAMDRAHRIGQKKTVNVYKLVTIDSIEEKIMKLHETKLAMSNAIVNAENSTLYSMGTDQLLDIFRFRSESSSSKSEDIESNLDSLVERYEDEYTTLSVRDFVKSFQYRNECSET